MLIDLFFIFSVDLVVYFLSIIWGWVTYGFQSIPKKLLKHSTAKHKTNEGGELADYIPELKKVDPNLFGIAITTVDGANVLSWRCPKIFFSLQSISKPFCFLRRPFKSLELIKFVSGLVLSQRVMYFIRRLNSITHRGVPLIHLSILGQIAMTDLIDGPDLENRFSVSKGKKSKIIADAR